MTCRVLTCCCGCQLRVGCILIGSLYTVYSLFIALMYIILIALCVAKDSYDPQGESLGALIFATIICTIFMIFCACLIMGAILYNVLLCISWIIAFLVFSVADLLCRILPICLNLEGKRRYYADFSGKSIYDVDNYVKGELASHIIIVVISLAIGIYCIIVIYSFIYEIKNGLIGNRSSSERGYVYHQDQD